MNEHFDPREDLAAAGLVWRQAGPEDEPFLLDVFTHTRADELAHMHWRPDQIELFLRLQCKAQKQEYERWFPDGMHRVLLHEGRPIGRIWTGRSAEEIRLLDMVLVEGYCGRGIGSLLVRRLQREAGRQGLPLRINIWKNAGQFFRFYERLGFKAVEERENDVVLEWRETAGL